MKLVQTQFLLPLLLTAPTFAAPAAIDCGGAGALLGSTFYETDRLYTPANGSGAVGGSSFVPGPLLTGGVIEGIASQKLFASYRQGLSEYRFDVENGTYLLTLHFVETQLHGPNLRMFSIAAEGIPLLTNFDIFSLYGKNFGVTYRFAVTVFDGQMNVMFTAGLNQPIVSGIAVEPITPDTAPPPIPANTVAQGTYHRNVIRWPDVAARDLFGYHVYRTAQVGGPYIRLTPVATPVSRYFDDAVNDGEIFFYAVTAVDVFGNQSNPSGVVVARVLANSDSQLPVYELTMQPEDLSALRVNPFEDEEVPGDFLHNSEAFPDINVRFRGSVSRTYNKKSFRLNFKGSAPFHEHDKLHLKALGMDESMIRDCLAYSILGRTAALTSHCLFVNFQINGEHLGLYNDIEGIDEDFALVRGLDEFGKIFEAEHPVLGGFHVLDDYSTAWDDDSADQDGFDQLAQLVETINSTPDEQFAATISAMLNVDSYLDYYATMTLIGDPDHTGHNFSVYRNASGIWEIIGKDHDLAFRHRALSILYGTSAAPDLFFGATNVLTERVLNVPRFRQWYVNKLFELMLVDFRPEVLNPRIDGYHAHVRDDALRDVLKRGREIPLLFLSSPSGLKEFITARRLNVFSQLASVSPGLAQPVMINELLADNQSGVTDDAGEREDWIEVFNRSGSPFDLSGHYLTNDPSDRTMWPFPAKTVIPPGGHLVVWADGDTGQGPLHSSFSISGDGQAVALYGPDADGNPLIDVIAFTRLNPDGSYGRRFSGSSLWTVQAVPTPGAGNTGF